MPPNVSRHRRRRERSVEKNAGNIFVAALAGRPTMFSGFENPDGELTGGIQATGNYPGKARNIDEVRADLLKVKSLLPGSHRINLHEVYGDFGGKKVDRDEVTPDHFTSWSNGPKRTD